MANNALKSFVARNLDAIQTLEGALRNTIALNEARLQWSSTALTDMSHFADRSMARHIVLDGSTANVTQFQYAFSRCIMLADLPKPIDVASARDMTDMFDRCSSLSKVTLLNFGTVQDVTLSDNTFNFPWGVGSEAAKESVLDSLMRYSAARSTPLNVKLTSQTLALLNDHEREVIENKGYILSAI